MSKSYAFSCVVLDYKKTQLQIFGLYHIRIRKKLTLCRSTVTARSYIATLIFFLGKWNVQKFGHLLWHNIHIIFTKKLYFEVLLRQPITHTNTYNKPLLSAYRLTDFNVTNLFSQPTAFHTRRLFDTSSFGRLYVRRFQHINYSTLFHICCASFAFPLDRHVIS
jgi:hypothetical protein